jgi:hypothetical protein
MVPHFVQTMRGPNDGTVMSPGRWSTFMIASWRHCGHRTASDLTPFWRMLARSIGWIGSLKESYGDSEVDAACAVLDAREKAND